MNVRDILKEHQRLKNLAEDAMQNIGDSSRNVIKDSKNIEMYYVYLNKKVEFVK